MRCLALAQAWQDWAKARRREPKVVFACHRIPRPLESRLRREGMALLRVKARPGSRRDAEKTAEAARAICADWVVADGYAFGAAYQRRIRAGGVRLLLLDDYGHARSYSADIVLNQNASARASIYRRRLSHVRLLLGPRFALLRREFLRSRGRQTRSAARRVLVTMGGADRANVTLDVARALASLGDPRMNVRILVGPANRHRSALMRFLRTVSLGRWSIQSGGSMPAQMRWADLAVSAAGSSFWELAFLGVPSVLVVTARNQRDNAIALARRHGALVMDGRAGVTPAALAPVIVRLMTDARGLRTMRRLERKLVDGQGAARVLQKMMWGRKLARRDTRHGETA